MKILYTSDLHGKTLLYQDLIQWAIKESIDTLILGGDLLPQTGPSNQSIRTQVLFIQNELHHFLQTIKEKSVNSVFLIFGNNEWVATLPYFHRLEESNLCYLINQKTMNLNEELEITGYPFVPPTPFPPKDFEKLDKRGDPIQDHATAPSVSIQGEIQSIETDNYFRERSTIQEDLSKLSMTHRKNIMVMHAPPLNTTLDQLDNNQHRGSQAILEFLQNTQPLVSLHGHIHESPRKSGSYCQKIGHTLAINPGQINQHLSAVIFESEKVEKSLFHTIYGKPKRTM